MGDWLKSKLQDVDIRIVLIVFFIAVSTGHVGRLFADREATGQEFLGYVLALAIDVALALSLYEIGYTQEKAHRIMALIGFLAACGISGGFNVYYYREFYPGDPVPLSVLLGLAAPVLAAFFALLKAKGDVERQGTESQTELGRIELEHNLELEKRRLELEASKETARLVEAEKTKQLREQTKREKIKAEAERQAREIAEAERQRREREATCAVCKGIFTRESIEDGMCPSCLRSIQGKSHALPLELSLEILERDEWTCYYCGEDLHEVPSGERHIDHFVPKSKGGEDVVENLVTACQHCNLIKNDKMPNERELERFSLYLRAKAAGPNRRTQILELAHTNGDRRPLKQKEIAQILHTSPGWVSTVIREAEQNQGEEN